MDIDPGLVASIKIAVASLAGGIVRLLFKPAENLFKTVWLLVGCVTCGFYGTPAIMKWWGLDPEYAGAIGAALGLVGLSFAQGALKAADKLDLIAWIKRRGEV